MKAEARNLSKADAQALVELIESAEAAYAVLMGILETYTDIGDRERRLRIAKKLFKSIDKVKYQ